MRLDSGFLGSKGLKVHHQKYFKTPSLGKISGLQRAASFCGRGAIREKII